MAGKGECVHLVVGDLDACGVVAGQECGTDGESGFSARGADEVEDGFVGKQWLACKVLGDLGEQAVLDGVPLGGARWVMTDGDREPKAIGELGLKLEAPGATRRAVAATIVGQNEQLSGAGIREAPLCKPPSHDGVHGKIRGVV